MKLHDATQRLELRASTARIAALEANLASASSSSATATAKAHATVGAAKGGAAAARKEAREAKRSLSRTQGRVEALEAKLRAPSSNSSSKGAMTWTEDDVEEFERHISELTGELNVLKLSSVTPDVTWPSMSATRPRWPTCARSTASFNRRGIS